MYTRAKEGKPSGKLLIHSQRDQVAAVAARLALQARFAVDLLLAMMLLGSFTSTPSTSMLRYHVIERYADGNQHGIGTAVQIDGSGDQMVLVSDHALSPDTVFQIELKQDGEDPFIVEYVKNYPTVGVEREVVSPYVSLVRRRTPP